MSNVTLPFEKKDDDDENVLPFQGLEKGQVIQNVKIFSAAKLKTRECYFLLTKILYLITARSEGFTADEATNVFFAVTKLFQSKDAALRRMMYLLLKELSPLAQDTIIAFAILIKDVNSDVDMYQANAIRVISGIMDTGMLGQMERYLKQAIVARDPYVASSALVASHSLVERGGIDVIKRWLSEVQEALKSGSVMVQYHALALLHRLRSADRLAVSKLVRSYTGSAATLRSPLAQMLLVRFAYDVLEEEGRTGAANKERDKELVRFLESSLRHKSELVAFEAAKALVRLTGATEHELAGAVAVLQLFLSSPKATLRFAACRLLNEVASQHAAAIGSSCAYELENLLGDTNRAVATLAITTLLKVESEPRVERLMKQLSAFVADIADDFKLVVVEAIRALAAKFPSKYAAVMAFLAQLLRDQGGLEFKSAVVSTLLAIMARVPEAKELGLEHLCEFIEDCEHSALSKQVLHVLGEEGPRTRVPSRFIRYVYNRIILEAPPVRAAAVAALAKFGLHAPAVRAQVHTLLKRCLHDTDDEVRDRATLYLALLDQRATAEAPRVLDPLDVPLENLEAALVGYLDTQSELPFALQTVPRELPKNRATDAATSKTSPEARNEAQAAAVAAAVTRMTTLFARLGPLRASSSPEELTEREGAYTVHVVRHVYERHVVLEYAVTNTIKEHVLRHVTVALQPSDDDAPVRFTLRKIIPANEIGYGDTVQLYAVLERPALEAEGALSVATQAFENHLKFNLHEVDDAGEVEVDGFPDELALDDVKVRLADYLRRAPVSNWNEKWESLGEATQAVTTFGLATVTSIKEGVATLMKLLNLAPCDKTEAVDEANKAKHILLLAGEFVDTGIPVLARVRMRWSQQQGLGMELAVRSASATLNQALSNVAFGNS